MKLTLKEAEEIGFEIVYRDLMYLAMRNENVICEWLNIKNEALVTTCEWFKTKNEARVSVLSKFDDDCYHREAKGVNTIEDLKQLCKLING